MLLALLASTAALAGLTGAWSPCSLSAAETLRGRLSRATFALGALAGGLVTFGGLALLGAAAGLAAPAVAAAVAIAASAGEATGARIVPQVRRQVPESWRRLLPLPVAGGAYGVLLGLGWTTFVLTYAVWALAAVCVMLGDVAAGVAVGLGFGAGRALPVLAGLGAVLAERPRLLRRARLADGVALAACGLVLGAAPAAAQSAYPSITAAPATDPSASGARLAWQEPGTVGLLRDRAGTRRLPGRDPVLAGDRIAWRNGNTVTLADAQTLAPLATFPTPGATAIATDGERVVHRATLAGGREAIMDRHRVLFRVGPNGELGRPSMSGSRVVFHVANRKGTRIVEIDLGTGAGRVLRRVAGVQLLNPTIDGDRLLYVRASNVHQRLKLGRARPGRPRGDRTLWTTWPSVRADIGHEPGRTNHDRHYAPGKAPNRPPRAPKGINDTLWTTGLGPSTAYVTRLRAVRWSRPQAVVLEVRLPRALRVR
jgi:hypothetical protein